ncbi:hypothetical protein Tco_1090885 [Tanacetum coccineum]|uniref:Uncharacterized protein n=1 Tax=Tanacetum coccineum TaxID=301880 RepID=A0ABQ5I7E2_9ASTR
MQVLFNYPSSTVEYSECFAIGRVSYKEPSQNLRTDEPNALFSVDSYGELVGFMRQKENKTGISRYFGVDEGLICPHLVTLLPRPVEKEVKPLYSRFVKAGEMHAVLLYCDKFQTQRPMHLADAEGPKLHCWQLPSFSCSEKEYSVPCKSKAASVPAGSRNSSASVTTDGSDPAASRNRPAVNSAGRPKPTERTSSAGWLNPAARPYFRPSSVYFNNMYWPELYDPMNKGRWGTAVKTSAGYSWRGSKRPHFWASKSNGGSPSITGSTQIFLGNVISTPSASLELHQNKMLLCLVAKASSDEDPQMMLRVPFSMEKLKKTCTIDKTLFTQEDSRDIFLVRFMWMTSFFGSSSTNKALVCTECEVLMMGEFEMSAMEEMNFFLGLQVETVADAYVIVIMLVFSIGDGKSTTGGCQFWQKVNLMAVQEAVYCGYFFNICPSMLLLGCCAQIVNTAASCTFFLLPGWFQDDFLPARRLILAGSTLFLMVVILPAGCLISAGSTMAQSYNLDDANGFLTCLLMISEGSEGIGLEVGINFRVPLPQPLFVCRLGLNAAANEDAGSAAEAHLVPPSPLVSPVREPTPERQPASERPPSPSQTPPAQTFMFEEPLVSGPAPRPAGNPLSWSQPEGMTTILSFEDLDNIFLWKMTPTHAGFHCGGTPVSPMMLTTPTADAVVVAEDPATTNYEREEEEVPLRAIEVLLNPDSAWTEVLAEDCTKPGMIRGRTGLVRLSGSKVTGCGFGSQEDLPLFLKSAQWNWPAISEPPSKRQRVERGTSQPSSVPAATTQLLMIGFADSAAGGINEFFLDSDEDEQIGMSRVAADPDSVDDVLAEDYLSGYKQNRLRSQHGLDLLEGMSVSVTSFGMTWKIVGDTQDEWIVSSLGCILRAHVHVLEFNDHGEDCVYVCGQILSIRVTLALNGLFRHRLTVPPRTVGQLLLLGILFQTGPDWLTNIHFECYQKLDGIHFPCSCWDEKWLVQEGTALELASPEQTATGKDMSNPLYGCDGLPKTVRVFQFTLDSRSEKLDWFLLHQDWKLLFFDVATSFDSAVHRVHAVSFDAAVLDVAATVSAACIIAAGYIVSAGICDAAGSFRYSFLLEDLEAVPADYVPAGHVLISADRYRIC